MNGVFSNNLIALVLFPLIACGASIFFTWLAIPLLTAYGMLSPIGERHVHVKAIPRGGGIAIIAAFLLAECLFMLSPFHSLFHGALTVDKFRGLVLPLIIILCTGLWDDAKDMNPYWKLSLQMLAAFIAWNEGIQFDSIFGWHLSPLISCIFTMLWIAAFINAFNLIDGLDGLAAGLAALSSVCLGTVFIMKECYLDAVFIFCFGASCLGFLRYNFHPARLFMGDTGSMFLGFMIAVTGIVSANKAITLSSVVLPLLAAGIPLFDTFLAIWRRLSQRYINTFINHNRSGSVMTADRYHLHHRLFDATRSQSKTVLFMYSIALVLGALAVGASLFQDSLPGLGVIMLLIVASTMIKNMANIELWNSARLIYYGLSKPSRGMMIMLLHPILDMVLLIAACWCASYFFYGETVAMNHQRTLFNVLPVVGVLAVTKVYRVFWLRGGDFDYVYLAQVILIGQLFGAAADMYFGVADLKLFVGAHLMNFLLALLLIGGERIMLRYLKVAMIRNYKSTVSANGKPNRVLIYGGGIFSLVYFKVLFSRIDNAPIDVVGIIDDNPALKGMYIYGYKVLGGVKDINAIYAHAPFNKIIVTAIHLRPPMRRYLSRFCTRNNVPCTELSLNETDLRRTVAAEEAAKR